MRARRVAAKIPDELMDPMAREFFSFYGLARGHHPRARGGFTTTSQLAMMQFKSLDYIKEISPRPILIIAGAEAETLPISQAVYEAAAEPKELVVVPGTNHVDLYDDVTKIPFAKLAAFFGKALYALGKRDRGQAPVTWHPSHATRHTVGSEA